VVGNGTIHKGVVGPSIITFPLSLRVRAERYCRFCAPLFAIPPLVSSKFPPWGTWGNFGETGCVVGKSGVLQHKRRNISETCKDGGKLTMECL